MDHIQKTNQKYSHRSSFMQYAELALQQGVPLDEIMKKLAEMELEIQQSLQEFSKKSGPRLN